jgi:SpoVK/Ycf46/Vps4 family AAA+-type ATPase
MRGANTSTSGRQRKVAFRELTRHRDITHIRDPFDPSSLDDLVFPSEGAATYLKRWVARSTATRNILLYGPPGTGKTRAAHLLARERSAGYLDLDPVRYVECETGTFDSLLQIEKGESSVFDLMLNPDFQRITILDEVDTFKRDQQKQLKKILERTDLTYVLLTNHLDKLDTAVRDRCYEIPWFMPPFARCKERLRAISIQYLDTNLDDETLEDSVYTTAGWRQMLRNLERHAA